MSTSGLIRTLPGPDVGSDGVVLAVPALGVVVSEALLFFGYVYPSLWVHLAVLLFCTLAPQRYGDEVMAFRAFALVPLFRLVNLGMPVFFQLTVFWFPLIYGPLVPGVYVLVGDVDEVTPRLRPKLGLVGLPAAVALGMVLGAIEYAIIEPQQLIPAWTVPQVAMITVVMVCFVGFVEELIFRGVLQRTLQGRFGYWPGILFASGVFGLMHSGYGVPVELVFAGTIGLLYGLLYDYTDSLALVSVTHGVLNVFLFAVYPIHGYPTAWLG